MEKTTLLAEPGSILDKCVAAKPDMNDDLRKRLLLLEQYDLGFLLLGLSPRRLLRDGRLFDNEQVLPLLLWFSQWDKHCRYVAAEVMKQWLVFNPANDDFEGVPDGTAVEFRDYFFKKYAIPLIGEFRQYVALSMLFPDEHNAPSGPVDMVWHAFPTRSSTRTSASASGSAPSICLRRSPKRSTARQRASVGGTNVKQDRMSARGGTGRGADALADAAVREFHERGFFVLPSVLPASQVRDLQELVARRYQDPATHENPESDLVRGGVSFMRMFEYDRAFRDVLVLEPVISLVEAILGADCHVIAQNALRTPRGKGIINWHIDDALFFPFLADLPAIPTFAGALPCYTLNVMIALTDIDTEDLGPTQVVAGSHLTGREPEYAPTLPPEVTPTSLLARAGDVYLVNSQTWHRGAQNQTGRVRYVLTTTYGRRFISQRFFPFLNYRMPPQVLDGAPDRLLRLLGKHEKGPYG